MTRGICAILRGTRGYTEDGMLARAGQREAGVQHAPERGPAGSPDEFSPFKASEGEAWESRQKGL